MYKETVKLITTLPGMRGFVESSPITKPLVNKFIAGRERSDVLNVTERLLGERRFVTADLCGEELKKAEDTNSPRDEYIRLIDNLANQRERMNIPVLSSNVSMKLSQMGLAIDDELCKKNLVQILDQAKACNMFVRFDMEAARTIPATLKIYNQIKEPYPNTGLVFQSALLRTEEDIKTYKGTRVRLVKGAYNESPQDAYQSKLEVDGNFLKCVKTLLNFNSYPAIATHDEKMIEAAIAEANDLGRSAEEFEFQMLYGVRPDEQEELIKRGWSLRIYIPYGKEWYPYMTRRIAESPANLRFIAGSIFGSLNPLYKAA
jgi:proline dehydrogenase